MGGMNGNVVRPLGGLCRSTSLPGTEGCVAWYSVTAFSAGHDILISVIIKRKSIGKVDTVSYGFFMKDM